MAIELSNTVLRAAATKEANNETIDMRTGLADPMLKPPMDNEEVKARVKRFSILHKNILKTGIAVPKVVRRGNRTPVICGNMTKEGFTLDMAPPICLVLAYSTIGPMTWAKHYTKVYSSVEPPKEFKIVYLAWVPPYFSQDAYGKEYPPRLVSINAFDDMTTLNTSYTDLDQSLGTRGIVPPVKLRFTSNIFSLPHNISAGVNVSIPGLDKLPGNLGKMYLDKIRRINEFPAWLAAIPGAARHAVAEIQRVRPGLVYRAAPIAAPAVRPAPELARFADVDRFEPGDGNIPIGVHREPRLRGINDID